MSAIMSESVKEFITKNVTGIVTAAILVALVIVCVFNPPVTQIEAVVPSGEFAFPEPLKRTGQQDIVLRVEARDAEKVRGLAGQRNRRLRVTVE